MDYYSLAVRRGHSHDQAMVAKSLFAHAYDVFKSGYSADAPIIQFFNLVIAGTSAHEQSFKRFLSSITVVISENTPAIIHTEEFKDQGADAASYMILTQALATVKGVA